MVNPSMEDVTAWKIGFELPHDKIVFLGQNKGLLADDSFDSWIFYEHLGKTWFFSEVENPISIQYAYSHCSCTLDELPQQLSLKLFGRFFDACLKEYHHVCLAASLTSPLGKKKPRKI